MSDLLSCQEKWNQARCIIKLIETIISLILILYASYEIYKGIQDKFRFNFIFVLLILIIITLSFNVSHSIFNEVILLILEILFANIFFLTIFYYVGFNVLVTNWTKIILHCFYGIFIFF